MSTDVNTLAARMSEAYARGGYTAAEPYAEQVLAQVDRWYLRTHPDALYLRARVRHVLSQAAGDRGDHATARRHVADGLKAAARASRLRDERIAFETVMLLVARAELHLEAGDGASALADYDAAAHVEDRLGHPMWWEAQVHLRLGRGWALQQQGALDRAEDDARAALTIASEHEPRLVSLCLDRLAMLRRLVGTSDAEQLATAAEAVGATQPLDAARRAERARHAASLALEQGDADAAGRHLDEAERAYLEIGNEAQAAGLAAARAEVLRLRGDAAGAVREALSAADRSRAAHNPTGEAEAYTALGLALDDLGRGDDALAAHDRARALVTEPAELVRVDVRRAVAAFNTAVRRTNELRSGAGDAGAGDAGVLATEELDKAVDIAVPCALAADALRFGLPPGELRETWTREVSARIVDAALQMLTVAGRADEILDLLEHVAAGVALEPVQDDVGHTGFTPGRDLLAAPPRVRSTPGAASAVGWAIDAARERYGFAARTDEVVDAW